MIVAALFEWQRKSELSADRAGLLATQDPAVAFRVHMKLASGSGDLSELDQTSFFAQGQEYLDAGDLRDSVLKLLLDRAGHAPLRRRTRGRAAPLGRLRRVHRRSCRAPTRVATTTTPRACRRRPSRPRTATPRRSQTQDAAGQAGPRRGRLLRQRQALARRAAAPHPDTGDGCGPAADAYARGRLRFRRACGNARQWTSSSRAVRSGRGRSGADRSEAALAQPVLGQAREVAGVVQPAERSRRGRRPVPVPAST